jgi:hypothetical protein
MEPEQFSAEPISVEYCQWFNISHNLIHSPGLVILDRGIPFAACGVVGLWRGVAEAWFHIDREGMTPARTRCIVLTARNALEATAMAMHLHRLQCHVLQSDLLSQQFVEHFGFTVESKVRWYGPQREEFLCCARFFEVQSPIDPSLN